MKLSIVIPCYKERDTIESLLQAVKDSPVKDKEIVIVDDGSTDGTRDFLGALNDPLDYP
jgi:glycosyltransferase involved in cell wall biosynthesis